MLRENLVLHSKAIYPKSLHPGKIQLSAKKSVHPWNKDISSDTVQIHIYRKSSQPLGCLFNFGPSRGGLNREGGSLERQDYSQDQVIRIYLVAF